MRWTPRGYGGERRPPEEIKRNGWREQVCSPCPSTTIGSRGPSASS